MSWRSAHEKARAFRCAGFFCAKLTAFALRLGRFLRRLRTWSLRRFLLSGRFFRSLGRESGRRTGSPGANFRLAGLQQLQKGGTAGVAEAALVALDNPCI